MNFNTDIFRRAMVAQIGGTQPQHIDILKLVEDWMQGERSGLLIMGLVGTGKSTIAAACCRAWQDILTTARFVQCDILAERIKQDETNKYEIAYHKGLLVLDDFGTEMKVWGEESIPFIIYRRYERNLPTIITTNYNSGLIAQRYGERIADRLRTWSRIVMDYESLRK